MQRLIRPASFSRSCTSMAVASSARLLKRKFNVVLVNPQIPQNTGSIGRTCLAFGARLHLVGPYGFKLDDKSVLRAGLDYWRFVDLKEYANWETFENTTFKSLEHNSFWFSKFGTTSLLDVDFTTKSYVPDLIRSTAKETIVNMDETDSITLLFGSETSGLHRLVGTEKVNAHTTVYMPMLSTNHREHDTPSFNLAASVAMGLWEAFRQNHAKPLPQTPI